jgi:tRNA nucleotidyltransferase (CCA-adding enzyme)
MNIPDKAQQIITLLLAHGARDALIVGGFVRDSLLGVPCKDIDIEVYGMPYEKIVELLAMLYPINLVGKSFGVIKVDDKIDVSVPRRDSKTGAGHRGFHAEHDPDMTIEEAAARRDFTINSMAMRIGGTIIDPFNGRLHLRTRLLVATSDAFVEDPLRALRAMQFAARFRLGMDDHTLGLCRSMLSQKSELPKERIWEEWRKWATKGTSLSLGLYLMEKMNWLDPELQALVGVPQDPEYHPEGDVWVHTGHVVDQAVKVAEREQLDDNDRLVLVFAALCHDFGKPNTTTMIDGRWRSLGHCAEGIEPTYKFLDRIGAPKFVQDMVPPLVDEHLSHISITKPTDRAVRRLARRLHPASIKLWSLLVESDSSGRPPLPVSNPTNHIVEIANRLHVDLQQPKPILMGRHLIHLGFNPGPHMGNMLEIAFEAQINGEFGDIKAGKSWIRKHFTPQDE